MTASNTLPRGFARATAADVRTWAGLPLDQRGRLSKDTKDAFNKAHSTGSPRMKYVGPVERTQEYTFKPEKGRKVTATAKPSVVRAWAADNGYDVSGRGRLHREVEAAYAEAHGKVRR